MAGENGSNGVPPGPGPEGAGSPQGAPGQQAKGGTPPEAKPSQNVTEKTGQVTEAKKAATPKGEEQVYEWKVDGKTKRGTLADLQRAAALGDGAHEKIKLGASLEKQVNEFLRRLYTDPMAALAGLQIDPDVAYQRYLEQKAQQKTMSPEQRRILELEAERERMKSDQQKQAEELERQNAERDSIQLEQQLLAAVEKLGVPRNDPTILREMVEAGLRAHDLKVQLSPEEIAAEVMYQRKLQREELKNSLKDMDPEQVAELLGDEGIKAQLNRSVEKMKTAGPAPFRAPDGKFSSPAKPKAEVGEKKFLTEKDLKKRWGF